MTSKKSVTKKQSSKDRKRSAHFVKSGLKAAAALIEATRASQDKISAWNKGRNRELYALLVDPYEISTRLIAEPELWPLFLEQPYFAESDRRLNPNKEFKHLVRHVTNATFRAKSKHKLNRTSQYAKVMKSFLDEGLPPDSLAETIEENGGIQRIYLGMLAKKKAASANNKGSSKTKKTTENSKSAKSGKSAQSKQFEMSRRIRRRLDKTHDEQEVTIVVKRFGEDDRGHARFKILRANRIRLPNADF